MHLQVVGGDDLLFFLDWPSVVDDRVAGQAHMWLTDQEAQDVELQRR